MSAILSPSLAKPAAAQLHRTDVCVTAKSISELDRQRDPDGVTGRAIRYAIAQFHIAGCVHVLKGTVPDQPAADPDDDRVQELYLVARTCGC